MEPIGQLEKAKAGTKRKVNKLWKSTILMPGDDPKNNLCDHFNFIDITSPSGRYKGMYRIMPAETQKDMNTDTIQYKCEHVLATLMDPVMDGHHVFTDMTIREVLQAILDLQFEGEKHWELGTVEFDTFLNYSFEDENTLLAPIFEVPKNLIEPYMFVPDTTVYPFKLHLLKASNEVVADKRWGRDMGSFRKVTDPTNMTNWLIPKGDGEGVNKLTIEDVNGGKNYLKDQESIDNWGIKSSIWRDQRFEDKITLKARGQAILNQNKDPKLSIRSKMYDLSIKEEYKHTEAILNGVTSIIVEEQGDKEYLARILEEDIPDLAKEWDVNYQIGNRTDNAASAYADLKRRLDVNDSYGVGATNIMAFSYQDNADSKIPAKITFYVDDDVIHVNTCELTFRTTNFRTYSEATGGGGSVVKSTSSGGGTTATSSSGGGTTATSSSGGGTSKSTASGGGTTQSSSMFLLGDDAFTLGPTVADYDSHWHRLPANRFDHNHSVTVPSHSHSFSTPNHSHSVDIPNHTHGVTIPNHTHDITLPNHTHDVLHKIIELPELPNSVTIKVDGNEILFNEIEGDRIDIVDYMSKNTDGKIKRGRHEVTILPNERARIEADLILRIFIRSHLGVNL
ncbi:phage minor structural protein, N-terminal region [Virgibacillus subterraneus]|uniref:Phage minor structural protein, N-terminal region n=1 Tax=Virgibacillus subterraneus TaxID=621109 RepID=A0A1H9EEA5_9BACI|nr:phage tail spike protein [Virgibacillus subterraneus]SEQ23975.1 phage minor structural protein, N-terminal region [Virgibacillus subterraneus]